MNDKPAPKFTEEIMPIPGFEWGWQGVKHYFVLSDGQLGHWESFRSPKTLWLGVLALTTGGKVILVEIFRFPKKDFSIECPGGANDGNEDFATAAQRELLEETGYKTEKSLTEIVRGWQAGDVDKKFVVFLARDCHKVQKPHWDEVEKYCGITVIEKPLPEIIKEISENPRNRYSTLVGYILFVCWCKGLITQCF